MSDLQITPLSLLFTSVLVLLSLFISYKEDLGFEKDILVAALRAFIQLSIAGFVLLKIFDVDNIYITLLAVLVIVLNAAWNASKRGEEIQNSFRISLISISITTVGILGILLVSGSLKFVPSQVIPITGMIAGNSMSAIGVSYSNLVNFFTDNYQKVQEKLALGATPREASIGLIQQTIANGLIPTIDKSKTMGLVSLPGMMTGLLFAGVTPTKAILYQIMVMFVMISAASITVFISTYFAYRTFFSEREELRLQNKES